MRTYRPPNRVMPAESGAPPEQGAAIYQKESMPRNSSCAPTGPRVSPVRCRGREFVAFGTASMRPEWSTQCRSRPPAPTRTFPVAATVSAPPVRDRTQSGGQPASSSSCSTHIAVAPATAQGMTTKFSTGTARAAIAAPPKPRLRKRRAYRRRRSSAKPIPLFAMG